MFRKVKYLQSQTFLFSRLKIHTSPISECTWCYMFQSWTWRSGVEILIEYFFYFSLPMWPKYTFGNGFNKKILIHWEFMFVDTHWLYISYTVCPNKKETCFINEIPSLSRKFSSNNMLHYQGHFLFFHLIPNTWWYLNAWLKRNNLNSCMSKSICAE